MRTSRIRLLAATGVTLAALALTACQGDGTGTKDEGASQSTATAPTGTAAEPSPDADGGTAPDGPSRAGGDGNTGGGKAAAGGSDSGSGSAGTSAGDGTDVSSTARVVCNGSHTTVTAQPVPRPLNHMLITVKNTGSRPCDLTYYPVLRFDEMQWAPRAVEDSKPQAVVGIAPGESAYAGVLLASADGSGDGGTTARKLTVGFQGMTPNSSGGPAATPSLPAKGVYYDSTLAVTYWQQSMDDALAY
ncbi:DUF4232 domain-containing protein [Streptomyces sp. NPDC007904]|uniref:DUF4232 domain-containing protein n=1 Tax=Streptomyces sp. NPDC007904 TaxID=3364787 RepID=UPI0036F0DCBA